ncbi:hypothetical protein Tco_1093926 [Tanacetum coccineum]|uniref:Uncharacterized protein n=1 Tax=Tanacetum coccineum TaxID=301880 RepID=A0ABQ5IGE7_9ASTR
MEESLTKFMAESAKRHEENSNIIKEIRASTDAAIRNQGASIKTLEIQIGQMSKVLQERGFEILHSSTETNPRDHVKSFLTAKADSTGILLFPRPLHDYCCDEWKEARELKILETYSIRTSLMRTTCSKEKDIGSFTLPCFIHNVCFDKALVDLGASTIILDIPEDDDVPLILGRLFLSTAHAKIDVFKRKITLRVGEEKIAFKSIKPATSIIRRVYMLKTNLDSKTELIGEDVNKSFNPYYGDYIKLNDLDVPSKPRMNQDDNFKPTIDENVIVNEPTNKCCHKMKFSCIVGYKHVIADFLPAKSINMMTKHFYNSIIKDEGDHKGKKLAATLIDIPIFVGNLSIISGFSIIDDMDVTSGVVLGMPFCKNFVSCQKIMEKFARRDKYEQIEEE